MKALKLNSFGDTMIEVLFAMAVAAAVLGGAYVAASRALQLGEMAQERAEATKLVQGQIEGMKYLASQNHAEIDSMAGAAPGAKMCVRSDSGPTHVDMSACPVSGFYTVTVYNETDKALSNCSDLTPTSYDLSQGTHPGQYLICATWAGPASFGNQEVAIRYRVH